MHRTLRRRRLIAVSLFSTVAALTVDIAPDAAAQAAAQQECVVDRLLVNSCRPWLGAAADNYPDVNGTGGQILAHEQRIGRPLDVVHLYTSPGQHQLSRASVMFATRPDTILSVTWRPAPSRWSDADGTDADTNADIDRMADSIAALRPARIMLTVHHEPENDVSGGAEGCANRTGYIGRVGTPAEYRTMWRTVRERFDARGVDNVVWVMNYMGYSRWDCMFDDLWPGNDLVDWVMWDPYNESRDFNNLVRHVYNYMTDNSSPTHDYLSKPWGLAEWGSWRQAPQDHAYLLNRTGKEVVEQNRWPKLKSYSVFDVGDTCRIAYDRDGNYDPVELDSYREFANSPAFTDPAPRRYAS